MEILESLKANKDLLTKWRRELHQIPEPGYKEFETGAYICKKLDDMGIAYDKNKGVTGIVAVIKSQHAEKTIAFRADMDALSLEEQTGLDFKSRKKGFMHGCGHDGHMTMLLGFADYVSKQKDRLKQNIVLIFQPAEEGPGGAALMLEEGLIENYGIDEIYGIHLHPEFEQGSLAISSGPVMAMTGEFDVDIQSKSGHGAMPHTANDATVIGTQMLSQFQTIISRNMNPTDASVLTVGRITAGERRNIIAEHMRLEGTIRAFSESAFKKIQSRMTTICEGLEKSFECKITCEHRTMYPPVVNHVSSVEQFKKANASLNVVAFPPQMIAEDFSFYLKAVPGAFVFLGTKNIEKNFVFPLHNSKFNFDEEALLYGIQSYINLLNYLGSDIK